MKWTGPLEGGVTQSLLSKFLECPYKFYIYAVLGLEEDKPPEPNLMWGDTFHKGLELAIEHHKTVAEFTPEDWEPIHEAIDEHLQKYWPQAPITFAESIKNMLTLYDSTYKEEFGDFETELKFSIPYEVNGRKVTIRGKADGVQKNGRRILVEHKCKGKIDLTQTFYETPHDLQVTLYSFALGTRAVIYDLIRIPDTMTYLPPKPQYQNPKYYINSLYHDKYWGDFPIFKKKGLWIRQTPPIELSDDLINVNMMTMVNPIIDRLCKYWDYVTQPEFDFENPKYYNHLFYKTPIRHFDPARTVSYKGSYWDLMVGNITLDDLKPVNSFYAELETV